MKNINIYINKNILIKNISKSNIIQNLKLFLLSSSFLFLLLFFLIKFFIGYYSLNVFCIILFCLQPPGHMLFYVFYKNKYSSYSLKQAEKFLIMVNFILIFIKIFIEFYSNHTSMLNTLNCYKLLK